MKYATMTAIVALALVAGPVAAVAQPTNSTSGGDHHSGGGGGGDHHSGGGGGGGGTHPAGGGQPAAAVTHNTTTTTQAVTHGGGGGGGQQHDWRGQGGTRGGGTTTNQPQTFTNTNQPQTFDRRGGQPGGGDPRDHADQFGGGRGDWDHGDHRDWRGGPGGPGGFARGPAGVPGAGHALRQQDAGRRWFDARQFPREFRAQQRFNVRFYRPNGWYYRSWGYGETLPWGWFAPSFYLDYEDYGLPYPPIGCEWVREGPDAVLVNVWSGEILSVWRNIFW